MASVTKFVLNGTTIDVEDNVARTSAQTASDNVTTLTGRVSAIEGLARLTAAYDESTKTITFTNQTHK